MDDVMTLISVACLLSSDCDLAICSRRSSTDSQTGLTSSTTSCFILSIRLRSHVKVKVFPHAAGVKRAR